MATEIRDVGETLVALLRENLSDLVQAPEDEIALLPPAEAKIGGVRLTLFLFSIAPTIEMRNTLEIPGGDEVLSQPLDLYYLLTAFAPNEGTSATERTLESHSLLGAAMRVFFDNGILSGSVLRGDLPRDEELRLTIQPMTVEDLTRIWTVFPESILHASVGYLVSPVRLRSQRTSEAKSRVIQRLVKTDQISSENTRNS